MTPQQALNEQAQAERLAGQLLTQYVHAVTCTDRSRILGRALWEAGRAGAYAEMAERLEGEIKGEPRGARR